MISNKYYVLILNNNINNKIINDYLPSSSLPNNWIGKRVFAKYIIRIIINNYLYTLKNGIHESIIIIKLIGRW